MRNILIILSILSILVTKSVKSQTTDFNCPRCCKLTVNPQNGKYLIGCFCPNECTCSSPYYCDCPDNCKLGEVWSQCGGINWKGPFSCQSGLKCVYSSEWYSQCKPSNENPPVTTAATQLVNQNQGAIWTQCGGINWKGPLSCQPGLECVYSSEWYSQCKPA